MTKFGFSTRAVHAGREEDSWGATVPPIVSSAAFAFPSSDEAFRRFQSDEGYVYTRYANPSIRHAEEKIASLEEAEEALLCSSGMFAITVAVVSQLKAGDHLISEQSIYGGTYNLFTQVLPRWGIEVTFVNSLNRAELKAALRPTSKLLFLESPGNPLLKILPLGDLASFAREQGMHTLVDSTFATPFFQTPLRLGCDLVVHSATKFLGGHGDLTAGVVAGKKEFIDPMRKIYHRQMGGNLSPFEAFLLARGLQTLALRMQQSGETALELAHFLEKEEKVQAVHYPGLLSHPQHSLACAQMSGFGGVLAFELKGGYAAAVKFQDSLRLIKRVASLGDVHTLIMHPASSSHRMLNERERAARGISDGLLRLSVGLEDYPDLAEDISCALAVL